MAKGIDKSKMKCNRPRALRKGEAGYGKKKKVVLGCQSGRQKLVKYGAKGYEHNYSKTAKTSFRKRHKCDTAGDKTTARHWACKDLWGKDMKVSTPNRKKNIRRRK